MVCDGLSESQIARRLKRSRQLIYTQYIGPLRERCGLPVRPYRYEKPRAA